MYVSPCVSICSIDSSTRTCKGCNRTIEQISQWSSMSDQERMEIMKNLGYATRRKYDRSENLRRYDKG